MRNIDPHSRNYTSLVGCVNISYRELRQLFGRPGRGDDRDKTRAEWVIATPTGVVTVYDWHSQVRPKRVTAWHVGGHDVATAQALMARHGLELELAPRRLTPGMATRKGAPHEPHDQ